MGDLVNIHAGTGVYLVTRHPSGRGSPQGGTIPPTAEGVGPCPAAPASNLVGKKTNSAQLRNSGV